jgi:hypothetical protein
LLRIIEFVGPVGAVLFFRLFAESFRFELANLRFGEIQFRLQLEIATDGISMQTFPIPDIALEFTNLPSKLSIFAPQLTDFVTQLMDQGGQCLKLVGDRIL